MNKHKILSCKNCCFYKDYYIKCICSFDKQKAGFCICIQKPVYSNDLCEQFKYRQHKQKRITIEHLDIVIKDLEELEHIFYDSNC